MKLILDNCVHVLAWELFPGHIVEHASDVGWSSIKNGNLIRQAAAQYDVFVTTDKKIRYEQNLSKLPIAIVELNTFLTRLADLRTLAPFTAQAVQHTLKYLFVSVKPDGTFELLAPRPPSPATAP